MKLHRTVSIFAIFLQTTGVHAQIVGVSPAYAQQTVLFTTPGANSFTVPPNVTSITVDACASGGGGGGGGTSGGNAGGGGGGAGSNLHNYTLNVTPGATLTITIGTGGTAGAINGNGGNGLTGTQISGANNPFPSLFNGLGGVGTTGTTGGAGGAGSAGGGGSGGAAGANGTSGSFL